jgi:hypothetical protein
MADTSDEAWVFFAFQFLAKPSNVAVALASIALATVTRCAV